MPKTRICVLLATHNGEKYVYEQIQSILVQTNADCDLYVSDDCSSDNTLKIVKEVSRLNNNVKLLRHDQKFGSAAANFYRLVRDVDFDCYDYVSLSDQDDIWNPDKLETAVHKIQSNSVEAYSSNVIAFWPNGKEKTLVKSGRQRKYDFLFEPAGPGCTYVFTKSAANYLKRRLLGSSEMSSFPKHDWLMYALLRSGNRKWYIDEFPSMMYRQHGINEVGANVGIDAKLKRIKMLTKGEYLGNVKKLCSILEIDTETFFSNSLIMLRWRFVKNLFEIRRDSIEGLALVLMVLLGIARVSI